MAWQDRIQAAAYTSPSGTRLEFEYEDVSKTFSKKTTAFEFAGFDGTLVQDQGVTGRRFPLKLWFSGDDHDQVADDFEAMLDERGIGVLEHPLYGRHPVVPFGEIKRRDRLKTASNQTLFELTFFKTAEVELPLPSKSPADQTEEAIDDFNEAAPEEFADKTDTETTGEAVSLRTRYRAVVDQVKQGLNAVAATNAATESQYQTVADAIDSDLDTLIGTPLTLAFQAGIISQLPARTAALISDRLDAYQNLLGIVAANFYSPSLGSELKNSFRVDDLFAANMIVGAVAAVVSNTFTIKTEALAAADQLLTMCGQWVTWRDQNFENLSEIDTGETYQAVDRACSIAAGFLVEISFSLKQERSITLDRARTPIDLESELYGTVDENLDFLLNTNNLVGTEILEIPAGREIKYYV